ncbi:unnamed protein product [Fusarium venenatum]|uniref:Uncharacterized protein n=1 Tax=Fusarium venenatum TaxID=56646 RepID=A0A2L2TDU1_9HYPO|nr:uncharacterized protein FVRRES_08335 [Fusarium venenatum]CEI68258.1 unnamed protein product [Fusarium venenatum]
MRSFSTPPFADQPAVYGATCASIETLVQFDGLFAGIIVLDETEPTINRPRIGGNGFQATHHRGGSVTNTADGQSCRGHENPWDSIRFIRDGMEPLWARFVNVAVNLNNVAINSILDDYQDANGLRHTGAIALRNVFSGPVPNDLCKIFAICCFSHVISHLLCERNRLAQGDVLAGVHVWLYTLEKEHEREAFKLLVQNLWPESQHHLHRMDPVPPFQPGTINPSLINIQPTVMSPTNLQNFANLQQGFGFSPDLLNDTSRDLGPSSPHWQGFSPELSYVFMSSWASTPLSTTYDSPIPSQYDAQLGQSPPVASADPNTSSHLQQTSVFTAVVQYVQENGGFWYNLAGRGLVSKDFRECHAWSQERLSHKREIQRSFIVPLSSEKETRDLVSRSIVTVAEAFVERGLLQEREEIEFYMKWVGTLVFNNQTSSREFRDWIHGFRKSSTAEFVITDRSANLKRHVELPHDNNGKAKRKNKKSRRN